MGRTKDLAIDMMNRQPLPDSFFRELDCHQEIEFRRWARENYRRGDAISQLWHPVVRDECQKMNHEHEPHIPVSSCP